MRKEVEVVKGVMGMTEQEWLELKKYLDEHDIEYDTQITYISCFSSSFVILLPPVTCYHERN